MSKEARSRGACWTCRLRRKKCDEDIPTCSSCTSRSLPCYGYDQPVWADGGFQQKAKAKELQVLIRNAASSRRRHTKVQSVDRSPDSSNTRSSTSDSGDSWSSTGQHNPFNAGTVFGEIQSLLVETVPTRSGKSLQPVDRASQPDLLEHYLNVIFPTQFPMSTESANIRDWLLPLLLQVKPMYHAAISLAAYDRRLMEPASNKVDYGSLHHVLALKELRQFLGECHGHDLMTTLEATIEVLASMVLLIFLEVFLGDTQSWHIHLKAPSLLLPGLRQSCSKSGRGVVSGPHSKALYFFAGVIAWFDALGCISGSSPWASAFCLGHDSGLIYMQNITGCENAVVLLIMEVAELHVSKRKFLSAGTDALISTASRIEEDLLVWALPSGPRAAQKDVALSPKLKDSVQIVTNVFANAALVYMHAVLSHPAKLYESVGGSLTALEAVSDPNVLGTMAWPLFVTGCMAAGPQICGIKKIFSSLDNVPPVPAKNMLRCQAIVEEAWCIQNQTSEDNLLSNMEKAMTNLDLRVLLV